MKRSNDDARPSTSAKFQKILDLSRTSAKLFTMDQLLDLSRTSAKLFTMDQLPDVALLEIFGKLFYDDLCRCAQVCRRWYALTQSSSFKKKIVVRRLSEPWQLPLLVQYHFHERLEELHVWFDDKDAHFFPIQKETFYSMRTKCPQLKKLVFLWCSLANVTLEDMPASLNCLSLRLSKFNPHQFFGGRPNFSAPHITCLDVSGKFLSSEDLHMFTKLKSLRCLFMACCQIWDGIESITDILSHLEVLDLELTYISNEDVQTIITHGSHLKELYIGHTRIDDGAFQKDHFDRLRKLRALCVRGTRITSSTIKEFANSDVKIKNGDFDFSYFDKVGKEQFPLLHYPLCSHYLLHHC